MVETIRTAAAARLPLSVLLAGVLLLAGCAHPSGPLSRLMGGAAQPVELVEVPFQPQTAYHCGPAALAMVLGWSGVAADPQRLATELYIPAKKGTLQPELLARARRYGRLAYVIPPRLSALLRELEAGHPVLVLQNLGLSWYPVPHYAVVIGAEPRSGNLILRSGTQRRHIVAAETFDRTWARTKRWGIVVLPPGELPATATQAKLFQALADLDTSSSPAKTLPTWRAAETRFPHDSHFPLGLANALYHSGQLDAAAAVLKNALERLPRHNAALYNNLAQIEADRGNWDAAEAAAAKAVNLGGPFLPISRATLHEIQCHRAGNRKPCPPAP